MLDLEPKTLNRLQALFYIVAISMFFTALIINLNTIRKMREEKALKNK